MIYTLVKVNLRALFAGIYKGGRRGRKNSASKRKPVSVVLIAIMVAYIAVAVMFSMGAMFHGLCAPMFDAGLGWFFFALAGLVVFALGFIGGIFMVQTQIFHARDNELLLSMPIKPSAILAGRLSALMIMEYMFEFLILIPVLVVLIITGYISNLPLLGIVFFAGAAILLPLFALALGCFIGWLVALASSRMRRKNVVTLLLSIAFLAAYFWGYSKMMGNIGMLMTNGAEIAEAVRRAVFPAYHLGIAIAEGSVVSFLLFAVCAAVPFTIMCLLLSVSFMRLTTGGRGAKKVEYREKTARVSGAQQALLRRELLSYWSQPMYIMNSSLGAIVSIILFGIMIVRPGVVTGLFEPGTGALAGFIDPGHACAAVLGALAMMNFISAPSISLEGKGLWIVKSLPAKTRDILLSKVMLHFIVSAAASIAAGIACIVAFAISDFVQIALTLVLPTSAALLFALLGVTLNLAFPRFDWINPIQPVKQGMSAMISMFGGMSLIVALALVYALLLGPALALDYYLLYCTVAFLAVSAGLYASLMRGGVSKFEAL